MLEIKVYLFVVNIKNFIKQVIVFSIDCLVNNNLERMTKEILSEETEENNRST
jgi:hypothetical protein